MAIDKPEFPHYYWRTNGEHRRSLMATLPLLPDTETHPESRPKLIGIARLAAAGESVREGHNVVLHLGLDLFSAGWSARGTFRLVGRSILIADASLPASIVMRAIPTNSWN